MPLYQYTARNQSGQVSSGQLEADTNAAAVNQLRTMGLWVTDLRALGERASGGPGGKSFAGEYVYPIHSGVSAKDKSLFYRQLYSTMAAGMPIYQALQTIGQQTPNGRLRGGIQGITQEVHGGGRISEAMGRYPWLFSRLEVRMVEAGEMGGLLEDVFRRLADYLEREYHLRQQIQQRTLYPKILLLAIIFIPSVVTWYLRGFTAYITDIGRTWAPPAIGLLVAVIVLRYMLKAAGARAFYDQIKLLLPVVGPQVRKLAISRFARALAALYHAGVPLATAVAASGDASDNAVLIRATRRIVPSLEQGVGLTQAMAATGFFPPMFMGMVSTGEQTGSLDASLDKAADYYESEASHATIQLMVVLGVVLLLIMAIVVASKVIGFYAGSIGGVYDGLLQGE